nr:retrovirus-related Pol polyprotein from transposon TNT 1-94 [Tanacetum cinerariifolium]
MTLEHDSLSPGIQCQQNVSHADKTVTTSNELDFLFSLMFDELLNGSSKVVSKSSVVSSADAPNQRLHHTTSLNNHTTPAPTCQVPTLAPIVTSNENMTQAETYAENDQVADDEFINIFSTPVQDQGETSSRHVHYEFIDDVNDPKTRGVIFAAEGILHQTSVARTPEQNDIVERRNRTLVEAAQTMLSAAKVPLFFWVEAIATTCFTQNCSLVIPRHEKIPYHIINERKPSVKFFHIFGSLCYIVRDGENLDKMKEKGDACIFVGYSTQSKAYKVFNKRTRMIMESIHVNFDELPHMANAFKSQRPSVLGKPTTFSNSFIRKDFSKSTSVTKNNVSNDFSKPVTAQTLRTQKKSCLKNTDVLVSGMYKIHTDHTQARTSKLPQDSKQTNKRVSFSTGVIPTTSVSRPQLKSNPQGDRVLRSNSRGKKLEVEEHRRNVKLPKNKMSVTACNDSLNAKTLNVKSAFVMCAKCVMIDKHDVCVPKSVAKPLQKTIASVSNRKPRNNVRKLHECFGKTYKWTYIKFTPSGYIWKPKSKQENVNPNATSSQAWLWHRRLSHLNFDTINLLSKNDIVVGLLKLKFVKDHLCPSCELGKAKRKSFHSKLTPSSKIRLHLLHMDLCGPMRVASINGKRYVLVIVDDFSRYTWTHFLRSKDETLEVLIDFLRLVHRGLQAQVRVNGVVERWNRTLVEAARTMLSATKVPLFFWAEAIATACFTQNRSLVIPCHEKTPYHIINEHKPSVKFFYIFGSVCYIVRDG